MVTAYRISRFSNRDIGERFIGCFDNEKKIESYVFGFYLGKNCDDDHVLVFIHRGGPSATVVTEEDLHDAVAIYQALERDIRQGTAVLNRMTGEKFFERWGDVNPNRFEKNARRRKNIERFEAWKTHRSESPEF